MPSKNNLKDMKTKSNQYFHVPFEVKSSSYSDDGHYRARVKGYASTPTLDRYDDIVEPYAFEKSIRTTYRKNPIILFQHNSNYPIGKATSMVIDEKGLYIEADIYDKETAPKIREGILSTFSIGFIPKEVEFRDADGRLLDPSEDNIWANGVKRIIKNVDLVEVSVVSVPANPDAIFTVEKSIKKFFKNYNVNKEIMSKNLLETKEEEVSEAQAPVADESLTPEPEEVVETPVDEQVGTDGDVVETPADETSGEEDGDEKNTDDEVATGEDDQEGKGVFEKHDLSMKDVSNDDEDDEEVEVVSDEGKSVKVSKSLLTAQNFLDLAKKNNELQSQIDELKSSVAKLPAMYSEVEHKMPSTKDSSKSSPFSGIKDALANNQL